jgi:hypothetical protein
MTSAEMWAAVVAFLLPPVIALIQQEGWSERRKAIVAFGAAIVAGLGTTYFAGTLVFEAGNLMNILTNCLIVFLGAIAFYSEFWKKTGIAPKIQTATTVGSKRDV